jgi:Mg/Co/Ni transporter MgtE
MAYTNKNERIERSINLLAEVEERLLLEVNPEKKKELKQRLKFYKEMAEELLTKEEYNQMTTEAQKKAYENAGKVRQLGSYNYNKLMK